MTQDVKFESFADNVENYLYMDVLSEKMTIGARRGLMQSAKNIVKETKENIVNPPKTGVKYKRMRYRSSKEGEYPANQTGRLRRGIGYQMQGSKRVFVGSKAKYSKFLAFGTRFMGKRAFIGNVIKENVKDMYNTISNEINKELKI